MDGHVHNHRSDVGRRVASRREQLGLSREDVAGRAGVAPQYLRYLEERPSSPSVASLTRVARALETSVAELTGAEAPVVSGNPPPHGEMVKLAPDECYDLVALHAVGRVAVTTPEGPAIIPVNYGLVDGAVAFRTMPGAGPSFAPDAAETPFEVDALDEAQGVGWSVLLVGPAREVTDPAEIARLAEATPTEPWAPGDRDLWVRLRPSRATGLRVYLR
ncbi:helix-turn-helix domain-containing protein [Streptomyces sp. NBC_01803]|uniref:helix-turn-helix domain-containing protein n=1 Tax=Streptomyces sp. NBC_01803 TaxID=2975946 RepID=UPI002DDBCB32|nr:pyridoxamine 5'-phosphate oxidase family protein [Streptomyces sp. NBC_01803]WSA46312.1 pyridoxamine 5'-phosphate oxidase family protein [Streptomyces sp. NBC_01803]